MGCEPEKVKVRRRVIRESGLKTFEAVLSQVVVPRAEEIGVIERLVREQRESEKYRQNDAGRYKKQILQKCFLPELIKYGHNSRRRS